VKLIYAAFQNCIDFKADPLPVPVPDPGFCHHSDSENFTYLLPLFNEIVYKV
jgi:hypothetical protein